MLNYLRPEVLYEDVRSRNISEMAEVDLFTFGPPCQSYSRQGNRAADSVELGQLGLYSVAYILHHKPRIALMEQVKDVVQSEFFQLVLNELATAGYSLYSQILRFYDYKRLPFYSKGTSVGSKPTCWECMMLKVHPNNIDS